MLLRSFASMDIEDPVIRSNVERIQRELSLTHADLKFVDPSILHITLLFLGDVEESLTREMCGFLKGEGLMPKRIMLEGLGFFPSASRPSVVWLGVTSGAEELSIVADRVAALLKPFGFAPDSKDFQSHITIARVKSGRNRDKLVEKARELSQEPIGEVTTSPVRLKKSTLTPKGPIYNTLCEARP